MEWQLHVWVLTGLHALVFILGVPGNALIIRVFAKKQRKTSTHIFILGLAIADLYVCLTTAALIAYWFFEYDIASSLVCQGGYYSVVLGVYYSLFVTTVIAVERYYAVCKPHEKIVTPFRARMAVLLSVAAAAFVSAPSLLFSDVIEGTISDVNQGNRTVYMCWPAPDDIAEWVGASAMYSIYVLSLVLVAVLYGKVYTTIRDKVLGPTSSMRPGASMRSIGSTSRRSSTPLSLSKIDEAEIIDNKIVMNSAACHSPAKYNGSVTNVNNGDVSTKSSPSKSISPKPIAGEGVEAQGQHESTKVTVNGGSTEDLVQQSEKDDGSRLNVGIDLQEEQVGFTNGTNVENEKITENVNITSNLNDINDSPAAEFKDNSSQDKNEGPSVDKPELNPMINGVKSCLAVSPNNTAPPSPAASPRKGPVVINPTLGAAFQNRHFEPIKYDDESDNDRDNSRGGKRQSSLMSFRGFLSRPLGSLSGASFNSQASTRSMASQNMQNKTTNMLLLVTIVTYVTWIPTLLSSVILIETPDHRDETFSEAVITILLVMKMLFVANHAANPFIYTIVNDRFRKDCIKELRLIFGCSQKRRF